MELQKGYHNNLGNMEIHSCKNAIPIQGILDNDNRVFPQVSPVRNHSSTDPFRIRGGKPIVEKYEKWQKTKTYDSPNPRKIS